MLQLSDATLQFIREHKDCDTRGLALTAARHPEVDMIQALQQIAGRQTAALKLPSWAAVDGLLYPMHLSMEQCSSEATASYKASLVSGDTFADLTGGLGADFSFIARNFRIADYVEKNETLCALATHNLPLLGFPDAHVHNATAEDYLMRMDPVDCIYLDPSRRDSNGGRVVRLSDCQPDVTALEKTLTRKARRVMIKLSPMLDIAAVLRELNSISQMHIIAAGGECKELLLILEKDVTEEPSVVCATLPSSIFRFTVSEEKGAACSIADRLGGYLYEPNAALMKGGCFRLLSERLGVNKLHPFSHLYTSDKLIDFPGRTFSVEGVSGFAKRQLKAFLTSIDRANVVVRNFPSSAEELRRRLKLKDGGDTFVFATTMRDGDKVLIKARRI